MRIARAPRSRTVEVEPTLVVQLRGDDARAYEEALTVLEAGSRRKLPAVVSRLLALGLKHPRKRVRLRTIVALASCGADRYTLPVLLKILQVGSAEERDYACEAILNGRQVRALPAIRAVLVDRDDQVRASALSTLASLSPGTPWRELTASTKDHSSLVRLTGAKIAAGLMKQNKSGRERLVAIIEGLLRRERDPLVRAEILEALYRTNRAPEYLAELLRLVRSRRDIVRWRATEALAHVSPRQSAAAIRKTLLDAGRTESAPRLRKRMLELARSISA